VISQFFFCVARQGRKGDDEFIFWIYTIARRVILYYARKEKIYSTSFLKSYFHGETLEIPVIHDFDHAMWVRQMCDKCLKKNYWEIYL